MRGPEPGLGYILRDLRESRVSDLRPTPRHRRPDGPERRPQTTDGARAQTRHGELCKLQSLVDCRMYTFRAVLYFKALAFQSTKYIRSNEVLKYHYLHLY